MQRRDARIAAPHATLPYALARPFLFGLDPEQAHDLTLDALARDAEHAAACALVRNARVEDPVTLAGLTLSRTASAWPPGSTRTAAASTALRRDGLRLHRGRHGHAAGRSPATRSRACSACPRREALINRLGFNNDGLDAFIAQRAARALSRAAAASSA